MPKIPRLPQLLDRKISKTGQTRGADDDEIFQNRVNRCSTVLIPYTFLGRWLPAPNASGEYEAGYIVLIPPSLLASGDITEATLHDERLTLGHNALVFYQTRLDWESYNPVSLGWHPATSRTPPLLGKYAARVAATTAIESGDRINRGFTTTQGKGAGIRVYEYADSQEIARCRQQLEALFWLCADSIESVVQAGMRIEDAAIRRTASLELSAANGLLDLGRLTSLRAVDPAGNTICPLCLSQISGLGFVTRLAQAEGRSVPDLTVTEVNLFHIEELRIGEFNHKTYNLGWGHHHCNTVVKDSGIDQTLKWMYNVVQRNIESGLTDFLEG